ncbi:allantoate amidohydrolase [Cellulomonas endophytica]|uniref:allantoate amidohydrolase n=1 Tax=Cellulomonas endophytica TaxID=2494735 RepID=UPI001F0BFB07|nr:allantoate amidohydrolase [Cellulomonas endophytica]
MSTGTPTGPRAGSRTDGLGLPPGALAAATARVMARCDELARLSSMSGGIERVYLSPEHARANRLAERWLREAGMATAQDAAGNLVGHLPGRDPDAPVLLLGSHLDTVRDAGRYDGIVGVLMAVEVVRLLGPRVRTWPFGLDVVAFWDEEGARFGKALLGSSALAGVWDPAWWDLRDADGVSLREAFTAFGLDPARVGEAARRPADLVGYLEAHIEQGPELDGAGEALGVVTSIAAARRWEIAVVGEARHAGGTPYDRRRDALVGASEAVLAVERICREEHHVVGTVGRLEAFPGAVNVVPGEVRLTLDLRGELDETRDATWARIGGELDALTGRRGLTWSATAVHDAPAVRCGPLFQDVLHAGIAAGGQGESPALFSRAGHDAMAVGRLTDVGMLFLRNPDGISHHPDEDVSAADVERGLGALAAAVLHLAHERSLV